MGGPGEGGFEGKLLRTLLASAGGCAGAAVSGGKCAEGALTAAISHLYNAEGGSKNYEQHEDAKRTAAESIAERGFRIVGFEVDVLTAFGVRRYDILVFDQSSRNYYGVEVKSTIGDTIWFKDEQVMKDAALMIGATKRYPGVFEAFTVSGPAQFVTVTGVWYEATCFGCNAALKFGPKRLDQILQRAGVSINRCDRPGMCTPR